MALSGKARLAGIMGWPVIHSRSPRLHGFWLEQYGIDGAYVPLGVRPEHAAEAIRALAKLGFAGCNVTAPHKEVAFATMDEVDAPARRLGAINTIVVLPDGRLSGSNTDGFGFIEHLKEQAQAWQPTGPALVLGAGGSARAVIGALIDAGVPTVRLANRTRGRAEQLAERFGGKVAVVDWAQRRAALEGAALLVNTTTLGMANQPPLDLDLAPLPASAVVYDIVYVPLVTPLLAAARARGLAAVDGLGMLLHQARPGFEKWFGITPQVTPALRAHVLRDLAQ
jgi:shikimate dehydrogenase